MACWNILLLNMISLICFRQRIAKLILDLWKETGQIYLQCLPCQRLVCQNRRDCRPEPGVCCSLWTMSLVFKYDNWYPSLLPVWKCDGYIRLHCAVYTSDVPWLAYMWWTWSHYYTDERIKFLVAASYFSVFSSASLFTIKKQIADADFGNF